MKTVKRIFWLALLIGMVAIGCKPDSPTDPRKNDQDPPMIGVSTSSVVFNATQGNGNPPTQSVSVNNAGDGDLTGLNVNVNYEHNQPTGWLSAQLNRTTAPATLTFQAVSSSLAKGTYSANVTVSSPVAGNSTQMVRATLTISADSQPVIQLSRSAVSFSAVQNGASPSSQTVSVTNGGSGSLTGLGVGVSYTRGQPSGWLAAVAANFAVGHSFNFSGLSTDIPIQYFIN